jgi:hypothetical protein
MLRALTPLVAGAIFLASGAVFAQQSAPAQKQDQPRKERRFDCSQAKDPKACEERRAKMKAAHEKAEAACKGKDGAARRDCVAHEMCTQAKDPAKCEARAKERGAKRKAAMEACKGKQGDDLKSCMRDQREKMRGKK